MTPADATGVAKDLPRRQLAGKRREETMRLLTEYRATRSPALLERLVEINSDLVRFIAQRFANRGEPLEDIVQVGFVGLIHAIERFEGDLGNEFSTFATPTIMGEIRRYFRDRSWALRVPRRLQENYLRAMRARDNLRSDLGREPSVEEIAAAISLDPSDVLAALEVSPAQHTASLQEPIGGEGSEEDTNLVGSHLGKVDDNLERVELTEALAGVMSQLTPRERQVVALRFVDQLSQTEVAKRLGISQMHVSRLQHAALVQLREALDKSGVAEADLSGSG